MFLSELKEKQPIKMLLIGETGAGKSGSLASLVKAGYRLHILDFDNGCQILGNLLTPEEAKNVEVEVLTDKMKATGLGMIPDGQPKAFMKGLQLLTDWCNKYKDKKDIIVLDSFTMFSNAAMRFTLAQAGRVAGPAQIQDWGTAQNYITNVLAMLYSSDVECNVIINAHIKYLEGEGGGLKIAQVNTLGSSLPPQVGRYFNNMFWAGQVGMKRVIRTKASPTMALKSAAPGKVKDEYPLETGMADIFAALQGGE